MASDTEIWNGKIPQALREIPALAIAQAQSLVYAELKRAYSKHRDIGSLHEGYVVTLEEFEEFWEQVKMKRSERDLLKIRAELVQVAAMAIRTIVDVVEPLLAEDPAGGF